MRKFAILALALFAAGCSGSSDSTDGGVDAGATDAGAKGGISAACAADADCQAGLFCSVDDPGGQCLKNCATAADCPTGSICTDESKCYLGCTAQSDCTRSAYECVDATTVDSHKTATCDIAPTAGSGAIGDACAKGADCATGMFCSTDDPRGQCLKNCATPADCPAGSTCTDESKCYKNCALPADCTRYGYTCVGANTLDGGAVNTCDITPDGGP